MDFQDNLVITNNNIIKTMKKNNYGVTPEGERAPQRVSQKMLMEATYNEIRECVEKISQKAEQISFVYNEIKNFTSQKLLLRFDDDTLTKLSAVKNEIKQIPDKLKDDIMKMNKSIKFVIRYSILFITLQAILVWVSLALTSKQVRDINQQIFNINTKTYNEYTDFGMWIYINYGAKEGEMWQKYTKERWNK